MWTADKDADMKAIFLCSSENMASKKIELLRNLNPWPVLYRCIAIPVHCFINWANNPTGSWSQRLWSVGLTVFLILKWSTVDIITIMILLFHLLFFAFNRILCSCYSNIKFISSFRRVISSIYWLSGHSQIFPWREGAISDPACVPLTIALKSVSKWIVW